MTQSDQISETLGYAVIAHKEGAQLGDVVHVFFDTKSKSISGMTLKKKTFGKESWFGVEEIELFGKDVVLIKSESSLTPVTNPDVLKGTSLKEMRGMRVVTMEGTQLGLLKDFEVRGENWSISELYLDDNLRLSVDSVEITIGPDQIIVPARYAQRVVKEPKPSPGFLQRIFSPNQAAAAQQEPPDNRVVT
jgi:uncharacterized protein YrrD